MPLQRLTKVNWGQDANAEMWRYVEENCLYWLAKTKNFRENELKRYAKIYKGTPEAKVKNTPWPNAANNVIQIAATQCDQLLSRVMSIYMTEPIWPVTVYGALQGQELINAVERAQMLEMFLTNSALDATELDMYRTEQIWWSSATRNGTGIINIPYYYSVERALISGEFVDNTTSSTKPFFRDFIKHDGPVPVNVPLNKFVNNLDYPKLDDSPFKFEIKTMSEYELRQHVEMDIYPQSKVERILGSPDREQKEILQQYMLESQGITGNSREGNCSSEYDILQVSFSYWHNNQKFSLFAHLHLASDTKLVCYYNFYPQNLNSYEDAKLAYDDEQYLGYGLVEMLEGYQNEVSITHNQRTDAGTLNNTTAFRINKNSKLHSIMTFYPGICIPADKDEIERLDTGNPFAADINSEQLTVSYAKERSGVDPAMGGTGGGIVNAKRGIYSAQGTFAALQQQNNRTSLRTSDIRAAHTRAGNKLTKIYAHFGLGNRLRQYAANAEALKAALESVRKGDLGLLVRPSTASINKEMEKQNDMLLIQNLERLYAGDAQIIQSLSQQGMPPELKQYYIGVLRAKNLMMKRLLRNFNYTDVDSLIPEPSFLKENRDNDIRGARSLQGDSPAQGSDTGSLSLPIGPTASTIPQ